MNSKDPIQDGNHAVVCPTCGRSFMKLAELLNIHSVGLAMYGSCPNCGCYIECSQLFKVIKREVYHGFDKDAYRKHTKKVDNSNEKEGRND